MKRILVTSTNPVKIEATKIGFDRLFPEEQFECIGMSVPSGVAAQPLCDGETLQGAQNRVLYAREADTMADFYVGIEGGLEKRPEGYLVVDWVVIENKAGQRGQGKMNAFYLPPAIADSTTMH
jgi:inosine/xanthosine triphosphatase